MTDANQDAVEAAARALYALNPIELAGEHVDGFKVSPNVIASWDDFAEWADPDPRDSYRAEARAAIAAYLAAREKQGWRELSTTPDPLYASDMAKQLNAGVSVQAALATYLKLAAGGGDG